MARWGAWFQQIGNSIVDPGDGIAPQAYVSANGDVMRGGPAGADAAAAVTGYAVISADNIDAAIALAMGCPIRQDGGSIEVGELMGLMAPPAEQMASSATA
jgi:hypothetical protein